jgi:hypothetical protein
MAVDGAYAEGLQPCAGVGEPGYKVLLDDITDPSGKALPMMTMLAFRLESNLQQLQTETGLPLRIVRCRNRQPQDPESFDGPLVRDLDVHTVVIEVWGTTLTVDAGTPHQEAAVGYLLVPVRLNELTAGQPRGAFLRSRQVKSIQSPDDVSALLAGGGELIAFTALAAGSRLLESQDYDKARTQLCKAEGLLKGRAGSLTDPMRTSLQTYARLLTGEAVTRARADTKYPADGPLKRLPIDPAAGCSGGA